MVSGQHGYLRLVRILAVADEPASLAWTAAQVRDLGVELVVSCGDLPFEALGWLAEAARAPLAFVPGNHDPDLSGYRPTRRGLVIRAGYVTEPPWPPGAVNLDGRVEEVAGLRLAGLGGCRRYRPGPNQYRERQQSRRVNRLVARSRRAGPVDVVVTHAPPLGVGDGEDPAHRGFEAFHRLIGALAPAMLLHGHVAPAPGAADAVLGATRVVNVFGHRLLDVGSPAGAARA